MAGSTDSWREWVESMIAPAAAVIVLGMSIAILVSWFTGELLLAQVRESWQPMVPNTAICFVLCAISLALHSRRQPGRTGIVATLASAPVILIAGLSAVEMVFGINVSPEAWMRLFVTLDAPGSQHMYMAPATVACFLLLSIALMGLGRSSAGRYPFSDILAVIAGMISGLVTMGYLYGAEPLFTVSQYPHMAITTAVLFDTLVLGVLFVHPRRGLAGICTSPFLGGRLARRLLPAAILFPTFLRIVYGFVYMLGYPNETRLAVISLVIIVSVAGTIILAAWYLNAMDARNQAAAADVLALNRQLEQRVAERTLQLELANRELESFAYSVAHDLRAPLRGIDGFSSAIEEDYADKLDDKGRHYVGRIRAATQRMGGMIDGLLNLSRLTRGAMAYDEVDLSATARSIVDELETHEPDRRVRVTIAENLRVRGDRTLLRVALENLLGNAWKFTSHTADAEIEFGCRTNGGPRREFFIRDNGAGFDMQYSEKLFSVFQRLHSTSDFSGTGIGLATVQRIVHKHGGDCWAEGAVNSGATFYFTLGEERESA